GDASQGLAQVRLSPGPSAVRFTLSARRTGPHYILSPASTTTWQWRSQRDPAATVPAPWSCLTGRQTRPFLTRRCAVQPMMTLAYQVAGLSPAGAPADRAEHRAYSAGRRPGDHQRGPGGLLRRREDLAARAGHPGERSRPVHRVVHRPGRGVRDAAD